MTENPTCEIKPIEFVRPADRDPAAEFKWPEGGVTRVPFQVFSDPEIYALEQRKIFRGPVWHYL